MPLGRFICSDSKTEALQMKKYTAQITLVWKVKNIHRPDG